MLTRGVWGTCGMCPQGLHGEPLPHLCEFVERYDHKISIPEGLHKIRQAVDGNAVRRAKEHAEVANALRRAKEQA